MVGHVRRRGIFFWGTALVGPVALIGAVSMSQVRASTERNAYGTSAAMPGMSAAQMARMAGHAAASTHTVLALHKKVVHITIHNFAFGPARIEVSPGTKLIWTNTDSDPHTVDSTKNIWSSEALDTGGTFARTFGKAGTFTYYCSIHPFMHGTVIVKK
jgi:plastocyanin